MKDGDGSGDGEWGWGWDEERKKERKKERKTERKKERKKDTRRHSFFKHMLGGEGCICNEVLFLKINVPHWDVFAYE